MGKYNNMPTRSLKKMNSPENISEEKIEAEINSLSKFLTQQELKDTWHEFQRAAGNHTSPNIVRFTDAKPSTKQVEKNTNKKDRSFNHPPKAAKKTPRTATPIKTLFNNKETARTDTHAAKQVSV